MELVGLLLGSEGVGSSQVSQRAAAGAALGSFMADAAELLYSCVMEHIEPLLDPTAHDAVRSPSSEPLNTCSTASAAAQDPMDVVSEALGR